MNDFEAKQQARRERLENAAARAQGRSTAALRQSRGITEHIPPGQPVLVGHHSERRHRRDLAKSWDKLGQSVKEQEKADRLARRAAAVGRGGVSSDDPDAVAKLRAQLESMEGARAEMKRLNAIARKSGVDAAIEAATSDKVREGIRTNLRYSPHCADGRRVFPPYAFSNLSGNMRRVKQRIETLERAQQAREDAERKAEERGGEPQPVHLGEGWRVEERHDINRIAFVFDGKPSQEVRALLKSSGFRWSRSECAWLMKLTGWGPHRAEYIAGKLSRGEVSPW